MQCLDKHNIWTQLPFRNLKTIKRNIHFSLIPQIFIDNYNVFTSKKKKKYLKVLNCLVYDKFGLPLKSMVQPKDCRFK